MTITDEMVERAAAEIHYAEYDRDSYPFENECDLQKRLLKQQARAALLAALGETHVVVPREPAAWLVGWHRANGEAGLTSYVNEDDARRAAKNLETYSASETMADVQPLYAVTSPERGDGK